MSYPYQRAIVTGGSSGIGFAVSRLLAKNGTDLILIARSEANLKTAASLLEHEKAKISQKIQICPIDVSEPEGVEKILLPLIGTTERVDLLVNCAGITATDYFENLGLDQFDRLMAVNIRGPWIITKAVLPFLTVPGARIINVASMAGIMGLFGYTAYGASKYALVGFSDALRAELIGRGISVSVLCPPDTDTPQLAEEEKTKPRETRAVAGYSKVMKPEKVAEILLSAAGRGEFLILCGVWNKIIHFLFSLLPGLVRKIMDSDAAKARAGRKGKV